MHILPSGPHALTTFCSSLIGISVNCVIDCGRTVPALLGSIAAVLGSIAAWPHYWQSLAFQRIAICYLTSV